MQGVIRIELTSVVISAHQNLCNHASGKQLKTTHDRKKSQEHQGPIANRLAQKLQNTQVGEYEKSNACHDAAKTPKEVTWSRAKSQKIMN
jgi:hypothetical protein